jgi:hypothetical protein
MKALLKKEQENGRDFKEDNRLLHLELIEL